MSSNASNKNVVHNKSKNINHHPRKNSKETAKATPANAKNSSTKQHSSPKSKLSKCRLTGLNISPILYDTVCRLGARSEANDNMHGSDDGLIGVFSGGPGTSTNSVVKMSTEFYFDLKGHTPEEAAQALPFQDLGLDIQSLGNDIGNSQYKILTSAQLYVIPQNSYLHNSNNANSVLVAGGTCMTSIADTITYSTEKEEALPRAVGVFSKLLKPTTNPNFIEVSRVNIQRFREKGYTFLDYSETAGKDRSSNIFRVGLFDPDTGETLPEDTILQAKIVLHWEFPMSYATQFEFSSLSRVSNLKSQYKPSEKPKKFAIQIPKSVRKGGI